MSVVRSKLPVSVHVGRCYSAERDYVTIEITDGVSGNRVLEIEMTPEEAAKLFLFNGNVELEATWWIKNLGKKREILQIEIDDLKNNYGNDGKWREHVECQTEKYVAEGWHVSDYEKDRRNFHKAKGDKYGMTLTRYVDVED